MHYGIDTSIYPSDAVMTELRKVFEFTGFYLAPAPSHGNRSWMAKLPYLRGLGYKFLPTYVGQQVIGPGSSNVTAAQGTIDGNEACSLARLAGFGANISGMRPADTPIFLDLENGPPYSDKQKAYVDAWIDAVVLKGFRPGIYCSHLLTDKFNSQRVSIWHFKVPTVARTNEAFPYKPPAGTGVPAIKPGCVARQFRQNVMLRPLGVLVDLNAAYDLKKLAS